MSSPLPTVLVCLLYIYFVRAWGPRFMLNRPPFELRQVLVVYNLFQIGFNGWLFYEIGRFGWFSGNYSLLCQPVDYSYNEPALRILRAGYLFYISKFIDLLDTVFFVLRKKNSQITMLHVIHHGILPITLWPGIRYVCGGHASFFAFLNAFVHVVMYFYYFMAAMGPKYQKYLYWKKYLTTLQMVQFVAATVHCFQLIFIECNFPIAVCWWIGGHEMVFFLLFLNFYRRTYKKESVQDHTTRNATSYDKNQ